ncbi:DUF2892 domain-containing protein, partial [Rhodococcus qingshengii]
GQAPRTTRRDHPGTVTGHAGIRGRLTHLNPQNLTIPLVDFMRSTAGRVLRIVVGIALITLAFSVGGAVGILAGVIGAVFVLTGVVNVCLLGPLFSVELRGRPKAS